MRVVQRNVSRQTSAPSISAFREWLSRSVLCIATAPASFKGWLVRYAALLPRSAALQAAASYEHGRGISCLRLCVHFLPCRTCYCRRFRCGGCRPMHKTSPQENRSILMVDRQFSQNELQQTLRELKKVLGWKSPETAVRGRH